MQRFLTGAHSQGRRAFRANYGNLRAGLVLLCVGFVVGAAVGPANADTSTSIYLYNSGGTAVNVTSSYSYHDNHIYDASNSVIGTVVAGGNITGSSGQTIGYITVDPT